MTSESRVRVRYAETDQMGVVYHANYLVWLEVGRTDFIRTLGLDYKALEAEGCRIAVVEAIARYKAPARYDDELLIRTRLAHLRGSLIHFNYEVFRAADDLLLAEGSTTHIVVDLDMKRAPLPPHFAAAFQSALTRAAQLPHEVVAARD